MELKFYTKCNLRCRYCFVRSGDYNRDFCIEKTHLLEWMAKTIEFKECNDLEIHIACYGEFLMHPQATEIIADLRNFSQIRVISAQSNGLLLTKERINALKAAGLDRLNISLNSLDEQKCNYLCRTKKYNLEKLLKMFDYILDAGMDLLIAPVWFFRVNDEGIEQIITLTKQLQQKNGEQRVLLGIQNYLEYRTGRKINKTRERDFPYFYEQLENLEAKHDIILKLGPADFGIHPAKALVPPLSLEEVSKVQILMPGRFSYEYIAALNPDWAVKVLSRGHHRPGDIIEVKVVRSNLHGNLMTAKFIP